MTREEFFESGSPIIYAAASPDQLLDAPLTRHEFEGLAVTVSSITNIPLDDRVRQALCSYIHSLPRDTHKITLAAAISAVHRECSMHLTWTLSNEMNAKAKAIAEAEKAKSDQPVLSVVESSTNETEANH